MMPGIGGGIQAAERPRISGKPDLNARRPDPKGRVPRKEGAPEKGATDPRGRKKDDKGRIKSKEEQEGVKWLWEQLKARIKATLEIARSREFAVVGLIFSAYGAGFFLWRVYFNVFLYLLPGAFASAVIYRILSKIQREKDEVEKEKDRLKLLEDRSQLLLENALDCVFTLDLQGNIKSFNRKSERVTGYMKKDVLGRSFGMFLPQEGIKDFFDKLQRAISTGTVPMYETEINTIYGRRNFEMTLAAIRFKDKLIGVQGIGRDTTDKRRLQKELKTATSDLERWSKRTVKKEMTILEMKNQIKTIKRELEAYSAENN